MTRQSFHDDDSEELFPEVEPQTTTANTNSAKAHLPLDGPVTGLTDPKTATSGTRLKQLNPPDSHFLNAAQGWLGLGDCRSALAELGLIHPSLRSHPDVLAARCDIFTLAMKWPAVVAVASALVQLIPDRPSGWVWRSFALHGLRQTQWAFDLLLPAACRFPEIPTIPYNLACYCAQLGRLEEARNWLEQACTVGDVTILRVAARSDPDLAPLFASEATL